MTFPFLRKEKISTDKKRFIRQLYAKYQFEILANSLSFQTPKIFVTSKRLNQDPAVHVWRTHTTQLSRDEMKCDSARDNATSTLFLTLPNTRKLDCAYGATSSDIQSWTYSLHKSHLLSQHPPRQRDKTGPPLGGVIN